MNTTQITTICGLVAAISGSLMAIPDVLAIPYAKVVLAALSGVALAVMGYFAKGRKDTGVV
jgi:hypothetical protein